MTDTPDLVVSANPRLDLSNTAIDKADAEVTRLCRGGRWQMRIPAQPDSDSDLVIAAALDAGREALAELASLRSLLGLQPGEQVCGSMSHGPDPRPCLMPAGHVDIPGRGWHRGLGGTWSL